MSIHPLFRLLRWPNLLTILAGTLLMMHGAMRAASGAVPPPLPLLPSLLAALGLMLAAAWGYVVNDLFDIRADRLNRRPRPLADGSLEPSHARYAAALLLILTGIAAIVGSIITEPPWLFPLVLAGIIILEYAYAAQLRRLPVAGTLLTATLVSLTVIFPAMITRHTAAMGMTGKAALLDFTMTYALFAFLATTAREQAKDMQDMDGDRLAGYLSIPICLGWTIARRALLINIGVLGLVISLAIMAALHSGSLYLAAYGLVAILLPLMLIFLQAMKISTPEAAARISGYLKLFLLPGLCSVLFI